LLDATGFFVRQVAAVDEEPHAAAEALRLFAAALREARTRYGRESGQGNITQKEFARMLGISGDRPEERYRLYEGAKREPPLWILAAIRRVTGYSLDDLIAQLPAGRRLERDRTPPVKPQPKGPKSPRPFPEAAQGGENRPDKADCENVVVPLPRPA
jgi:hypothetical protein